MFVDYHVIIIFTTSCVFIARFAHGFYVWARYNGCMRVRGKKYWLGIVLIAAGLAGFGWAFAEWRNQPTASPAQHGAGVSQPPSSVKPNAASVDNYRVPADNPQYITIDSIGVPKTRVIKLGLLKDNAIATPSNIYDTGWYGASSKPGQPGTMFIFGHVSNWQAKGVFYNLKKLSPGDTIRVTAGSGKTYVYSVERTKVYAYDQVDMQEVLSPVDPSVPGLSLMTCTGTVIKGTNEFSQRLVVFARLVQFLR